MAVLQVCDLGSLSLAKVREGCLHFRLNLELSFARLAPKAAKRLETTHACLDRLGRGALLLQSEEPDDLRAPEFVKLQQDKMV